MTDHIKARTMADDRIYENLPANPSVLKQVPNCFPLFYNVVL